MNGRTPGTRATDPLVTIAVPSFNQGRFLEQALGSIFEQDIPAEVFVMDGGSTDGSVDVIRRFEPRLAGWRSEPDEGQAAAINEGIAQGTAPYVCWLNSDDFYYPGGLRRLVQLLASEPDCSLVYAKCWTVSKTGKKVFPYVTMPFWPWLFANFCFIAQPATLITRSCWEQLGGLDSKLELAFDYDLWWRIHHRSGKPAYLRSFVAATRAHESTKTATQTELHYKESMEVVRRFRGSVPIKWRAAMPLARLFHRLQ